MPLIKLTTALITIMAIASASFMVGQDNPLPTPLPEVATIACPFGSEYSLSRGSDATVTIKCITK